MDPQRLQSMLRKLQAELRAAGPVNPERRKVMDDLWRDIETILASDPRSPTSRYSGLRDRLARVATEFEAAHPEVTAALERVIDGLVRLNL